MTTTDAANKFRYEGNAVTDTFAFNGRVFATTDLVVEIITRSTDVLEETLTINTDYDVTIATDGTASVEVTNATKIPDATQDIQIRRSLPQSQSLSLPTGTPFPAKNVETALDRLTALVQDLQEEVDRSIRIPVTDSDTAPDALEIIESADIATAAAATATAAAATATAAAASVNLPALGAANTVLQVNAGGAALEYEKVKALNVDINAAADTVITASDEIWFADATDTSLVKKDTVQGILDLVSSGGWVKLKEVTASAVATVDFVNGTGGVVLNSTYDSYVVVISNLVPATDNTILYMRTSSDAGSTFDSGASAYDAGGQRTIIDAAITVDTYGAENTTFMNICPAIGNAGGVSATVWIYNPAVADKMKARWEFTSIDNGGNTVTGSGGGIRDNAADVDGIRFLMSSGNITSGTFTLYGLA